MCNVFLISMYINCSICTGIFCCSSHSLRFVCAIRCTCGARLILNVSFESHNTPTEMENCVTTAQRIHFNLRCARVLLFFYFFSSFFGAVSVCMWNVRTYAIALSVSWANAERDTTTSVMNERLWSWACIATPIIIPALRIKIQFTIQTHCQWHNDNQQLNIQLNRVSERTNERVCVRASLQPKMLHHTDLLNIWIYINTRP